MDYNIVLYQLDEFENVLKKDGILYNFQVTNVDSKDELFKCINAVTQPSMVVIRINKHKIESYLLASEIRKLTEAKVLYLIEDSTSSEERVRHLGNGAVACLSLPIIPDELFRTCINHLMFEKEKMHLFEEQLLFEKQIKNKYLLIDDDLELDTRKRTVKYKNVVNYITPQTFDVLFYLVENKNTVKTRDEISRYVSGYSIVNSRNIDTHIKQIRKVLKEKIHTKRGVGYYYN